MLNQATTLVATPQRATRRCAIVAALGPTARVANLGRAALTVAFAAVPTIVTVVRGDRLESEPLILACLVGGATLGWAVEDPMAELLAPMPVSSPARATLRVLLVAVVATIGVALTGLVVALGPGLSSDVVDRGPEAATAAAVALAVGLVALRRGERAAGPVAITAGLLGAAFVAALAHRWPTALPSFAAGPTHNRWWVLAGVGAAAAIRAGRDPGHS